VSVTVPVYEIEWKIEKDGRTGYLYVYGQIASCYSWPVNHKPTYREICKAFARDLPEPIKDEETVKIKHSGDSPF
jgi:hypothetical protein